MTDAIKTLAAGTEAVTYVMSRRGCDEFKAVAVVWDIVEQERRKEMSAVEVASQTTQLTLRHVFWRPAEICTQQRAELAGFDIEVGVIDDYFNEMDGAKPVAETPGKKRLSQEAAALLEFYPDGPPPGTTRREMKYLVEQKVGHTISFSTLDRARKERVA